MKYSVAGLDTSITPEVFFRVMSEKDQLEAWCFLCKDRIHLMEYITNPMRIDDKPGCWLYTYKGKVILADFGYRQYHGFDCVTAFARLEGLPYYDACSILYSIVKNEYDYVMQFNRAIRKGNFVQSRALSTTDLTFFPRGFSVLAKDYFEPRHITPEQLKSDNVFEINGYKLRNKLYLAPKDELWLALSFPNVLRVKLYFPTSKKQGEQGFISSALQEDVWCFGNINQPTEDCFISKAWKDGREVYNTLQIDTYAFQGEGISDKEFLQVLNTTYNRKIIFFDNDLAGITAAVRLSDYLDNAILIFLPSEIGKDYDNYIIFNYSEATKWLEDVYAEICSFELESDISEE